MIARGLADLRLVLLDVQDIALEVAAMHAALADLCESTADSALNTEIPDSPATAPSAPAGEKTALRRWIGAHHLYFLFNMRAARAIHQAVAALAQLDSTRATPHLDTATRYAPFIPAGGLRDGHNEAGGAHRDR